MQYHKSIIFLVCINLIVSLVDYSDQENWSGDCATGLKMQSPINIQNSDIVEDDSKFSFQSIDYTTISSTSVGYQHGYSISTPTLDNGSIKVKINGTEYTYNIRNIHFHFHSEHKISNKLYDMEMHIVHENSDSSDTNNYHMVLAYIFEASGSTDNSFLQSIGFNTGETVTNVKVQDIVKNEDVYYYKGSLTTPDCTEDVNWVVIQDIKTMSTSQLETFKTYISSLNSAYASGNNRDVQDLNGRKSSNIVKYFK